MTDPIEPAATADSVAEETPLYLIGVRLREPLLAEDHLTTDTDLHVGDLVLVDLGGGTAVGEVRRPKRAAALVQARPRLSSGGPARHPRGSGRVARPPRARGARGGDVPAHGPRARARDEDRGRRDRALAPPRHRLLQLRGAGGLPRPRARPRPRVPRPDRDAPDRGARHHQAARRHRPLRPAALLLVAPAQVRSDLGQDGQGAGHAADRQPAARQLRAAQVLPALRVLDLRGAALAAAAR